MRKIFFSVFLVFAATVLAESSFKLVELVSPKVVGSGQKISFTVKLRAEVLDEPIFFRPEASIRWLKSNIAQNISGAALAPWKVEGVKAGDTFSVTANVTIDPKVPAGDAGIVAFGLWRRIEGKYIWSPIDGKTRLTFDLACEKPAELKTDASAKVLQMTIPPIKAPSIDGIPQEQEWKDAVETSAFVSSKDGSAYTPTTTVKLGYDAANLYLLFKTAIPAGYEEAQNRYNLHDGSIWNNEAAEMYFCPNPDEWDYYQFIVDIIGQKYDAFNNDFAGYNPVWEGATTIGNGFRYFEVKLPLAAITKKEVKAGTVWRADFFRYRNAGSSLSGWSPTFGGHSQTKRYGYLIFGSAKEAILQGTAFADAAKAKLGTATDASLAELFTQVEAIREFAKKATEQEAADRYQELEKELKGIASKMEKQLFAVLFKNSGAMLVLQEADAYSIRPPTQAVSLDGGKTNLFSRLEATFMADELRHFAFNATNIAQQPVTVRFSLRYGGTNNGFDFLRLGLPGYATTWRNAVTVACKDGSLSSDSMPENPSGVYRIGPGETVQVFLSVEPTKPLNDVKGLICMEPIDGSDFASLEIPVHFTTRGGRLKDAPDQPLSFGWDFLLSEISDERPDFAERHFQTLRKYGFNTVGISSLRYLPRPQANAKGEIPEKLDFTKLEKLIRIVGTKFDAYYMNVDIMEKKWQRKDLFGISIDAPLFEVAYKSWIAKVIAKCDELGVTSDKLVVCPYDENCGPIAQKVARWTKETSPKTRIIIDCSSDDMETVNKMNQFTDIWMPHLKTVNQEGYKPFYENIAKANKIVMNYYYCNSNVEKLKSPYCDYALNFWSCYERNVRGLGYWAAGQYYGDPWYRKIYKVNYDTALMYPTENGVIPSRRLFGWKRGMQDFQLLKLAESKLKASGQLEALEQLKLNVKLVRSYPNEPERAETIREYCRQLCE
ncbi:MAG: DUF4091 domain-containing protein [Victivallales bacterium]|nr:DUF4091 domain-containing protein [Victivallales bacterium]